MLRKWAGGHIPVEGDPRGGNKSQSRSRRIHVGGVEMNADKMLSRAELAMRAHFQRNETSLSRVMTPEAFA
jgi:hypothetical protein